MRLMPDARALAVWPRHHKHDEGALMGTLIDHPIEVFLSAFVVLSVAARIGKAPHAQRRHA